MIIDNRSTALLLLREPRGAAAGATGADESKDIALTANSQISKAGSAGEAGEASQSLFSVNATNLTKAKLELIDRTADALGVKRDDYAENKDFVAAMRDALATLKRNRGEQAVLDLEKQIGLDKLGLKITDVIDSASDPEREDKVTEALKLKLGILPSGETQRGLVAVDDIGIYRIKPM